MSVVSNTPIADRLAKLNGMASAPQVDTTDLYYVTSALGTSDPMLWEHASRVASEISSYADRAQVKSVSKRLVVATYLRGEYVQYRG